MQETYVPSLHEYTTCYQINAERLSARQVVMHPGPVNRGVELSSDVTDSAQALIGAQVRSGVVVRMAVLYELLAGARRTGGDPPDSTDAAGRTSTEAQLA
jgi:aspartate carbamoyltransferase catalytic subunit